jgi:hypothetical protein
MTLVFFKILILLCCAAEHQRNTWDNFQYYILSCHKLISALYTSRLSIHYIMSICDFDEIGYFLCSNTRIDAFGAFLMIF